MPKEDYLLKYLEKLGHILSMMLGFRRKGMPEEGLQVANEFFKEILHFNLNELAEMPMDQFIEIITHEAYTNTHLEAFTQLTHQTAKAFWANGENENANRFYAKALKMYYVLNEKDKTFSFEREMVIEELKTLTKDC